MKQEFNKIIGAGGIGTGMLFLTDDNKTLGRSESRLVQLSDAKDYCKLHIVFHYIATLLAPEKEVFPIGCVGADPAGEQLLLEMQQAGMNTSYVKKEATLPTTVSICLQYPDKEGCNFTASNGAGQSVTSKYIQACLNKIGPDSQTIVAALPEVSTESRLELLRRGYAAGSFCALSVVAGEAEWLRKQEALRFCDLLAVNLEEAAAIVQANDNPPALYERLHAYAAAYNPEIRLLVTCGKDGAWIGDQTGFEHVPVLPSTPVTTTGAGDAFLGGTLAALACGYPFRKGKSDGHFGETALSSAPELGTLCAGMAVESPDSIALQVTAEQIRQRIKTAGWDTAAWFAQ
ncbi:MAG: carbohydrate kinase family protein [Oscillospiraceae bacterium]|jgi:sugar/nucleoside kinase (ribokinase family)